MNVSPVTLTADRLVKPWVHSLRAEDNALVLPCQGMPGVAEGSSTMMVGMWSSEEKRSCRWWWHVWDCSTLPVTPRIWLAGVFSRPFPCWVLAFDGVLPWKPFAPCRNRLNVVLAQQDVWCRRCTPRWSCACSLARGSAMQDTSVTLPREAVPGNFLALVPRSIHSSGLLVLLGHKGHWSQLETKADRRTGGI